MFGLMPTWPRCGSRVMESDAPVKRFDCVACMREARERISAKISSMSHEEFRRWVNSSIAEDLILARFAASPLVRDKSVSA